MYANAGGLIHGTLVVGALLAAESARRENFPETIGAVALALLLYWLAHAYSDFTEHRLQHSEGLEMGRLGRTLVQELTILAGAVMPLVALLICWAVGATLVDAVTAAVWVSVAMIVTIEVIAGVRADLTNRQLAVQALFGISFGLMIIVLRIVLH